MLICFEYNIKSIIQLYDNCDKIGGSIFDNLLYYQVIINWRLRT